MFSHLQQVALGATDLDRATAFYRDVLGLRHIATYDPPGLVFFDLGNARLLIEKGAPASMLYLGVASIEETVAALEGAGVTITSRPHMIFKDDEGTFGDAGTEEWMAFFEDSEGNAVGVVERRPS